MAIKKKKGKKKSKAKKQKNPDDEDEDKCPIEFPEYLDPDIVTPRAKLKIQLIENICPKLSKYLKNSNCF